MKWRDLLGRPFKLHGCGPDGMDCSTVAEEVLRRLGMTPPATNPFRSPDHSGEEMTTYFSSMEAAYKQIGDKGADARKEGDVVLAKDPAGRPTLMYVLVDEVTGTFLTAEHGGGVRATRRFLLGDVTGVYRLQVEGSP